MKNTLCDLFCGIADAIRGCDGTGETIKPCDFPARIEALKAAGGSSEVRYVTFMSYDGLTEYGKKAVAVGDDCADPIARGVFETPTRESGVQFNYTFAGWSTQVNGGLDANALKAVEDDRTVYANFAAVVRTYKISFYDGDTLLTTKQVAYGSVPSYTPTKDGYDFAGWNPEPVAVTGEASYTAVWKAKATFETATWAEIAAVCAAGTHAEYFAVGDTKPVTLTYDDGTSETINFTIVDMNVDAISSTETAPLTLMAENIVSISPTALASADNKAFSNLHRMDTATAFLNRIYTALPADLQSIIKPYRSDSIGTMTNIFAAHAVNLGIEHTGWGNPDTPRYNAKYKHFANGASIKRTKKNDASADDYWTCARVNQTSGGNYTNYFFLAIDGTSRMSNAQRATEKHGIVPCFLI